MVVFVCTARHRPSCGLYLQSKRTVFVVFMLMVAVSVIAGAAVRGYRDDRVPRLLFSSMRSLTLRIAAAVIVAAITNAHVRSSWRSFL